MTTISAALVKELRDKTGAGMMDCKTALTETNGDIEAAVDWLRKKGLSKAAKKSGRIAADGLIGIVAKGHVGAVVEVNSETDFVARNDQFQSIVREITGLAVAANGDLAKLLAASYPGTSNTVDAHVKEAVATIGENLSVRRTTAIAVKDGVVADYVHSRVADGLGKIGVLVALESAGDEPALFELGRMIAMHVAAASPIALDAASVPADVMAREKAILEDKNQGKKPEMMEKIIAGGLKAYAKENCLLEQTYIHDQSKTVAQAVKEAEGKVGAPIKVAGFVRYALGEGIDKKEEDFAAEVAKVVSGQR
ncbi:MAG: elongation factor Ts [Hyphomicrobium sp.]|nr:MAG: elongation factor Ts [Hyphomicrobium sp.]PPD01505.1 MAG: elongation factor Ts [Hyphomicrobium sp.]